MDGHTGKRGGKEGEGRGVTVSSANHETAHVELSRASERFTERNPWFLPIQGLRTGREQHVPESSNHSLYLTKLLSSIFILRDTCEGNQHTQHTHTHQHILTNRPTHRPTHHHSPRQHTHTTHTTQHTPQHNTHTHQHTTHNTQHTTQHTTHNTTTTTTHTTTTRLNQVCDRAVFLFFPRVVAK